MRRFFHFVLISVLLVFSSFFVSSTYFVPAEAKDSSDRYQKIFDELKVFTDVLSLVERDYYRDVSGDELVEGAIKGMLTALDPHSGYLTPEFYKDLRVQTKGEFGGLGIEITIKDGLLVVVAPMEGSPAEQAGVKPGDKIIKIEGKFTKEFSLVDAVERLRGPKGSPIEISVMRKGYSDLIDITVIRDRIKVRSVRHRMLEDGYGYVRVNQFVESTGDNLGEALSSLNATSPGGQMRGLVLDLRNNPGGLLTQAIRVSDYFINDGVVVYTDGRIEAQKQKFFAQNRGTETNYPLVVLLNSGSASASEIVAGAVQDHGRGLVLGTSSFGKGSVQTITPLANGGALTLTTALYYTKSGRSIQATGIVPDIEFDPVLEEEKENVMPKTPAQRASRTRYREADLPGAIKNPNKKSSSRSDKEGHSTVIPKKKDKPVKSLTDMTLAELLERDAHLKRGLEVLRGYDSFFKTRTVLAN